MLSIFDSNLFLLGIFLYYSWVCGFRWKKIRWEIFFVLWLLFRFGGELNFRLEMFFSYSLGSRCGMFFRKGSWVVVLIMGIFVLVDEVFRWILRRVFLVFGARFSSFVGIFGVVICFFFFEGRTFFFWLGIFWSCFFYALFF